MSNNLMRRYLDILSENEQAVVSQQELMAAYNQSMPRAQPFIKVAVEAIFPKNSALAKKVEGRVGQLDDAKYREDQPLVVIQGHKKLGYDIYTNTAEILSQSKMKYDKPDALLKAALDSLNISLDEIDSAGGGLYIKKALTYMIPASSLGVENRTIDAGWGTQQVQPGSFLVLENYPNTTNIYCVNPDSDGNPTGYIPG
jgi:hypothetical protein